MSIFVNGLTKSTLECHDKIVQDVATRPTKVLRMLQLTDKNAQGVVTHLTNVHRVLCLA